MKNAYDMVVIGSGPAGQRAAVQAAKLGASALVIERDALGGSCLHRGTIPSKALREAAITHGMTHQGERAVVRDALREVSRVVAEEEGVISHQLSRNKVDYVQGEASFQDAHSISIKTPLGTEIVKATHVVLATGTRPHRAPELDFNSTSIFDSDSILELERSPKKMMVMGAGVIGCEYASIFAHMGSQVVLIERRTDLLRGVDHEMVKVLSHHFEKSGVELRLGAEVGKITAGVDGVEAELGGVREHFDVLLYCMGRIGNVEALQLQNAGLQPNPRGLLQVNERYQTSVPHILAVGDLIGAPALASSSAEQGRLAAAFALGHQDGEFPTSFPYGIYTIPELSSAGKMESELIANKQSYWVGRARYRELARGKILGDEEGLLKLLFCAETDVLLGVHVAGSQASELVHIGQVALALGAKLPFFVNHVFNYPTLAEAYKVAALQAANQKRDAARDA